MTTLVYTLLLKLWRGSITPQEAKTLLGVLHDEELTLKAELKAAYEVYLKNPKGSKINKNADQTWANILTQIDSETVTIKTVVWWKTRKMWWAAAAVFMVVELGMWLKTIPTLDSKMALRSVEAAPQIISNTATDTMTITLPDQSVVRLCPKSAISYRNSFNQYERNISIKGKVLFKVFKNRKLPFVVYADDVITTAIGTEFWVSTSQNNQVEIKLLEGKVAVRQHKPEAKAIYLLPGQTLTFSRLNNSFALASFGKVNDTFINRSSTASRQVESMNVDLAMVFTNRPLAEVFEQLSQHYRVKIIYQTEQLQGLYFTGNILKKDDLPTILTLITNMNGLHYEQVGEEILIKK